MSDHLIRQIAQFREKLQIKESGSMLMVKAVLAKMIQDKGYANFIDPTVLLENFHFPFILHEWSGGKASGWKWEDPSPDEYQRKILLEFMSQGPDLKSAHPALLGETYTLEEATTRQKQLGIFYTPWELIGTLGDMADAGSLIEKRILDPACGAGFILCGWYERLIKEHVQLGRSREEAHGMILRDQLFGMDVDPKAAWIAALTLQMYHEKYIEISSIREGDFLLDQLEIPEMDIVAGNPPYVGHKQLDREYFKLLKNKYPQVYYDKGDLAFCFFQRGLETLKEGGTLAYITSRYYMEAQNAQGLRKYLTKNAKIKEILDYYGHRPIKNAKVDPSITVLQKSCKKTSDRKVFVRRYSHQTGGLSSMYTIEESRLHPEGWTLLTPMESAMVDKIMRKKAWFLHELWDSRQGIITGLDKAFVLDQEEARDYPQKTVKRWIKNRHITAFRIGESDKRILYTDVLENIMDEPAVHERLEPYRERLSNRRECRNGLRPWYHLQWGRKQAFFEGEKVVYPYKSHANRFALDTESSYYSADVYGFVLSTETAHTYTNKSVVSLLNSTLYDFYFQSFGKKLGGALYEYYPNTVGRLAVPALSQGQVAELEEFHEKMQTMDLLERSQTKRELDQWVCSLFGMTPEEVRYLQHRKEKRG